MAHRAVGNRTNCLQITLIYNSEASNFFHSRIALVLECICGLLRLEKYFIVLVHLVASFTGMCFFRVFVFRSKFSHSPLVSKRLKLDFKTDWTTNDIILEFFVKKRAVFCRFLSASTEVCKNFPNFQICFLRK